MGEGFEIDIAKGECRQGRWAMPNPAKFHPLQCHSCSFYKVCKKLIELDEEINVDEVRRIQAGQEKTP